MEALRTLGEHTDIMTLYDDGAVLEDEADDGVVCRGYVGSQSVRGSCCIVYADLYGVTCRDGALLGGGTIGITEDKTTGDLSGVIGVILLMDDCGV